MTKERIVAVLRAASEPLTAIQVARRIGANLATTSSHLRSLRNRGLAVAVRRGTRRVNFWRAALTG